MGCAIFMTIERSTWNSTGQSSTFQGLNAWRRFLKLGQEQFHWRFKTFVFLTFPLSLLYLFSFFWNHPLISFGNLLRYGSFVIKELGAKISSIPAPRTSQHFSQLWVKFTWKKLLKGAFSIPLGVSGFDKKNWGLK